MFVWLFYWLRSLYCVWIGNHHQAIPYSTQSSNNNVGLCLVFRCKALTVIWRLSKIIVNIIELFRGTNPGVIIQIHSLAEDCIVRHVSAYPCQSQLLLASKMRCLLTKSATSANMIWSSVLGPFDTSFRMATRLYSLHQHFVTSFIYYRINIVAFASASNDDILWIYPERVHIGTPLQPSTNNPYPQLRGDCMWLRAPKFGLLKLYNCNAEA